MSPVAWVVAIVVGMLLVFAILFLWLSRETRDVPNMMGPPLVNIATLSPEVAAFVSAKNHEIERLKAEQEDNTRELAFKDEVIADLEQQVRRYKTDCANERQFYRDVSRLVDRRRESEPVLAGSEDRAG